MALVVTDAHLEQVAEFLRGNLPKRDAGNSGARSRQAVLGGGQRGMNAGAVQRFGQFDEGGHITDIGIEPRRDSALKRFACSVEIRILAKGGFHAVHDMIEIGLEEGGVHLRQRCGGIAGGVRVFRGD